MTTEVLAFNQGSGHTLPGPVMPETRPPAEDSESARLFIVAAFRAAGRPIPAWLAKPSARRSATQAAKPTDLVSALKSLWQTILKLTAHTDEIAAGMGKTFVEVDDAPRFAEPTPWSVHEEAGPDQDGSARGDEGIVERRTERDLRRQLETARKRARGAAFADRAGALAKVEALERELEQLLQHQREARVRRNFGGQ